MSEIIKINPETNEPLKVVVIGDGGVGKTSLLVTHLKGIFPTTPRDFFASNKVNDHNQTVDGVTYQLTLFDTFGHNDYRYYPGASVFIVCFSISLNRLTSFKNVSAKWLPVLRAKGPPNVPVLLVGTKMDLRPNNTISHKKVAKLVKEERLLQYIECSALTREGVTQVFDSAAQAAMGILKRKTDICTIF